ncbi:MAG: hypothetical protein V4490_06695, partial [Pseudomonadota bacterium]
MMMLPVPENYSLTELTTFLDGTLETPVGPFTVVDAENRRVEKVTVQEQRDFIQQKIEGYAVELDAINALDRNTAEVEINQRLCGFQKSFEYFWGQYYQRYINNVISDSTLTIGNPDQNFNLSNYLLDLNPITLAMNHLENRLNSRYVSAIEEMLEVLHEKVLSRLSDLGSDGFSLILMICPKIAIKGSDSPMEMAYTSRQFDTFARSFRTNFVANRLKSFTMNYIVSAIECEDPEISKKANAMIAEFNMMKYHFQMFVFMFDSYSDALGDEISRRVRGTSHFTKYMDSVNFALSCLHYMGNSFHDFSVEAVDSSLNKLVKLLTRPSVSSWRSVDASDEDEFGSEWVIEHAEAKSALLEEL